MRLTRDERRLLSERRQRQARDERECPKCGRAKGEPCLSLQYLVDLPIVHVERMRALEIGGGHDVR